MNERYSNFDLLLGEETQQPTHIYTWGFGLKSREAPGTSCFDNINYPKLLDNIPNKRWSQVSFGENHMAALSCDGHVYTMGRGAHGQLGHGDRKSKKTLTMVESLHDRHIVDVKCGKYMTVALSANGDLYTWGSSNSKLLGHGDFEFDDVLAPQRVEALIGLVVTEIACGSFLMIALTNTGDVYTWGYCGEGLLGHERCDNRFYFAPVRLDSFNSEKIVSISAGHSHSACITSSGELYTWGIAGPELGHGSDQHCFTPKLVQALKYVNVMQISCGYMHTALCSESGEMYTFGDGKSGQLGHGDKKDKTLPELVHALEGKDIIKVKCGYRITIALTSSGYLYTWGHGSIGHGKDSKTLSIPCLVEGLCEQIVVNISTNSLLGSSQCAAIIEPSSRSIQKLSLNKKEYADVVFIVENQPIYANTDILMKRSNYFRAMFQSNMRECVEKVVKIPDCSRAVFLLLLEFLYCDTFILRVEYAMALYHLADMYQIEGLMFLCMVTLEKDLREENVHDIIQQAEDIGCTCKNMRKICVEYKAQDDQNFCQTGIKHGQILREIEGTEHVRKKRRKIERPSTSKHPMNI